MRLVAALIAVAGVAIAVDAGWSLLRIGLHGTPQRPDRATAPNILFVTLDTARADHLSVYGYGRETSPNLARLAQDGFAFTEAFTVATYSGPSHATMFTGFFPLQHGLVDNGLRLSNEVMPLAELLHQLDYRTGAFVGYDVVGAETGLDRGFDTFDLHVIDSHDHDEKSLEHEVSGFRAARNWLENWQGGSKERPRRPFFLWLHAQQIHQSYDPPPPYDSRFMDVPRDVEVSGMDDFELRCSNDVRRAFEHGLLTAEMKAQVEALYDGEVRLVDDELGAVFDTLRQSGAYENTIILVVSDHGEQLFEETEVDFGRSGFRHGRIYFDNVLRIPWILKPQVAAVAEIGKRPAVMASTVDIFPTLLDLLGLDIPSSLPGRSLVPWMKNPKQPDPAATVYFQETPNERFYSGLRTADWKFVKKVKRGETTRWLMHLETDPGERTDAFSTNRQVAERLERQLDLWFSKQRAVTPASLAEMSERMRQALRDAGYLREDSDSEERHE